MVNSTYFTYDGKSSAAYGLMIADFTGLVPESVEENEAFSPSLTTLKVPSSPRLYHGGIEYSDAPTHEFTVVSQNEISLADRSAIMAWLIGRNSFLPLTFDSINGFTYYCVFTSASIVYVNGRCHGFRLVATFDSPFARGNPIIKEITGNGEHTIDIYDTNDINDRYIYPTVEFIGRYISIINTTDSDSRAFVFNNVRENVYGATLVDCETKVIRNATVDNFISKNWLRIRPGERNTLTVNIRSDIGVAFARITCPSYAMIGF